MSTTVERSRRITNLAMTSPGFVRAFGISEMSVGAFPSSGEEAKNIALEGKPKHGRSIHNGSVPRGGLFTRALARCCK